MKTANDAWKIVTHEDAELTKSVAARIAVTSLEDAASPSKLMDVLGDIEEIKREIQDRMRRIEAVKQAKSLLMEDAMRTEALNRRLAEIGKAMTAVHSGLLAAEEELAEEDSPRPDTLEMPIFSESRPAAVRPAHEGVAIAWPKPEEPARPALLVAKTVDAVEPVAVSQSAVEAVEVVDAAPASEAVPVPLKTIDSQSAAELPILSIEELAEELHSVAEASVEPAMISESQFAVEIASTPQAAEEMEMHSAAATEAALEAVAPAPVEDSVALAAMDEQPTELASATVAELAQSYNRAEELVAEARRLLEESSARLHVAVSREEQAALDLRAAQEAAEAANRAANDQLVEWERLWSKAERAAVEAKRSFDDSTSQLNLAMTKEQQSAADFQSAQQALTAAYQSASQRLEAAEVYCKDGDTFAQQTRELLDRIQVELAEARSGAEAANQDLLSARQELTTAYQFASVAAQRRLDSAEFFKKATRWVIFATGLAWVVAVWMAWLAFHKALPIGVPGAATCVLLLAAIYMGKRSVREVEEG